MGRAHNFIDRRGEKHISNEGEPVVIIEYFNAYNCTIQFEDGTIVNNLQYNNIKNRNIKKNNVHDCSNIELGITFKRC